MNNIVKVTKNNTNVVFEQENIHYVDLELLYQQTGIQKDLLILCAAQHENINTLEVKDTLVIKAEDVLLLLAKISINNLIDPEVKVAAIRFQEQVKEILNEKQNAVVSSPNPFDMIRMVVDQMEETDKKASLALETAAQAKEQVEYLTTANFKGKIEKNKLKTPEEFSEIKDLEKRKDELNYIVAHICEHTSQLYPEKWGEAYAFCQKIHRIPIPKQERLRNYKNRIDFIVKNNSKRYGTNLGDVCYEFFWKNYIRENHVYTWERGLKEELFPL